MSRGGNDAFGHAPARELRWSTAGQARGSNGIETLYAVIGRNPKAGRGGTKQAIRCRRMHRESTTEVATALTDRYQAHGYGKFKKHGLLGTRTEAEKMLMLAALNLVKCIAEVAPRRTR